MNVDQSVEDPRLRVLKILRKNGEERLPSHEFVSQLALVFRDYVNLSKCRNVKELLKLIESEGEYLLSVYPSEFILHNVIYTTIKFIREEAEKLINGGEEGSKASSNKIWENLKNSDLKVNMKELKKHVMGSIEEEYPVDLAEIALGNVTDSETVMTFKYSDSTTLRAFLKDVKFTILSVDDVVCKNLKEYPYIAISPIDIVIKMGIVTRVFLSAIAVLADGSCLMPAGTRTICEIAKNYSVPVIVCSAGYKFIPILSPNLNEFNQQGSTGSLLGRDSELLSASNLQISRPLFDHIPAKLVSLYITEDFTIDPSNVKKILTENYHSFDLYLLIN